MFGMVVHTGLVWSQQHPPDAFDLLGAKVTDLEFRIPLIQLFRIYLNVWLNIFMRKQMNDTKIFQQTSYNVRCFSQLFLHV